MALQMDKKQLLANQIRRRLAVKIYEEYNKAAMTAYPQLTNTDIDNILAYTAQDKVVPKPAAVVAAVNTGPSNGLGLTD